MFAPRPPVAAPLLSNATAPLELDVADEVEDKLRPATTAPCPLAALLN